MNKLPEEYLEKMKELLKDEYDDYLQSFEEERVYGLRVNTAKICVEDFLKIAPFHLKPIPWTSDGFYYDPDDLPSKHPYYFADLYYLQEPSAMLPAEVLPIEEGDIVLDCCAAPGGKSSKLANKLSGSGMLIANDISVSRAQVLLKTLESQGVKNAYVIAEDVTSLKQYEAFFDKILLDAPCSGEGMFRKESELIASWQKKGNEEYAALQKTIIEAAARLLKPGGMMVYSTCTFDIREDEEIIEHILSVDPSLSVVAIDPCEGFACGKTKNTKGCVRLYPHRIKGEGHFVALLSKKGDAPKESPHNISIPQNLKKLIPDDFHSVLNNGDLILRNDKLYLLPPYRLPMEKARILRSGLFLGEIRHERFEASQALALALKEKEYPKILSLSNDDPRVLRYLKCETLDVKDKGIEGLVLVCVDDFPLGFGKVAKGTLKNRYPANYRYQ